MMESTRSYAEVGYNSRELAQAIAPEELSPALWSTLPTELLERVLAFLPFPNLFRLRSVCRRWNALPHCSYFRQIRASAPRQWGACLPVLFCKDASIDTEDEGWNSDSWSAYDTASNEWLRLPPLTCLDARHPKYLVVGSGGLLCIGDFDSTENLVVCNPVTRCFRELSPTLGEWAEPDLTAMAIDKHTGSYRLVLAGNRSFSPDESGYRTTEVYNSTTRAWAIAGNIPANLELHSQEGALCSNVLYCLARDPKQGSWNTLTAYDLVSGKWTIVSQSIPHGSRTPHVIGSHGRILVVAECYDMVGDSECVILFELDLMTKKWRELSQLPNELYVGIGKRVIACTVDGDYICVTGCSASRWYSAMYRSSQNRWHQVPAFPVDESKGRDLCELLLSSSPFRPSLEPV